MTTHKGNQPLHRRLGDGRFEPLTAEDVERINKALTAAIANNDETSRRRIRNELIERHMRLIASIGKGYEHKLNAEDILAVGAVALTEAMERWSPAPGGMSAYQWAKRWITTALNKAVDAERQIRIPEQAAYRAAINTKIVKEEEARQGRRLSAEEIERLTGGGNRLEDLPIADVSLSGGAHPYAGSEDDYTLEEVIADPRPGADENLEREDVYERIRAALTTLTEEERTVIEHRFGLNGAEGKTLAELGAMLKASGEAIRRLEASALAKLSHPANPYGIGMP